LLGELDLEVYLVVLDHVLKATTKKVVNFLEEKKCTTDKILATPMHETTVILAPTEQNKLRPKEGNR